MKKTRKLLAALVLAAVLLPILASCSSLSSKKFLKYKDQSATEAVFQYLCCIEKTQYLYEAYGTDSSTTQASSLQDNPSLWTMLDSSGVSVGDTLKNSVLNKLKITMYLAQYAQDSGYVLNDTAKKSLKGQLDSFAANFESKSAFNEKLAEYGIDYDLLYDYYLLQGLSYRGEDLLFGEGAKYAATDARVQKYYDEHYFTFNFIYINNYNKTYPNGKTVILPEEERAKKSARIEELAGKIAVLNGEARAPEPAEGEEPEEITFPALCRAYSERFTDDTVEKGLTYHKGTFPVPAIEEAVLAAEEGKFVRVDVPKDGTYFVTRLPLNQAVLAEERETVVTELQDIDKQGLTDAAAAQFQVDEEFVASLSVADLKHVQ